MKPFPDMMTGRFRILFLLAALLPMPSWAAEEVINAFDDPGESTVYAGETWSVAAALSHDNADAAGQAGSGSLRMECALASAGGYQQSVVSRQIPQANAETGYLRLECDVKVAAGSSLRTGAQDYGVFEVIFRNGSGWTWNSLGGKRLTSEFTGWQRISFDVKAPADAVHHLTFKLGENDFGGPVTLLLDNVRWVLRETELPPPALSIAEARRGLNLSAVGAGDYDRQNIAAVSNAFGWLPDPGDAASARPVSVSVRFAEFPKVAEAPGFQSHLYFVPGVAGAESSPDWNQPSVLYAQIQANGAGGGYMVLRYKVNTPNSNGTYFSEGYSGTVGSARVEGEWTVSFQQEVAGGVAGALRATLRSPDGSVGELVIPAADAQAFAGGVTPYFGVMPNGQAGRNATARIDRIRLVAGAEEVVDEFKGVGLDAGLWVERAGAPGAVAVVSDEKVWIWWTTPAAGWYLRQSDDLVNWVDTGLTGVQAGTMRRVLVPGDFTRGPRSVFRMEKQ
jgi:hypothetical protein